MMEKQDGVQIIQTIALDISVSRVTQSRGQVQSCKCEALRVLSLGFIHGVYLSSVSRQPRSGGGGSLLRLRGRQHLWMGALISLIILTEKQRNDSNL